MAVIASFDDYLAVCRKFVLMFSLVVLSVTSGFVPCDDLVHGIDLSLVHFTGLMSLKLKRWCECIVFDREQLAGKMNSLGFFEAGELVGYGQTLHISADNFLELGIFADRGKIALDVILASPVHGPGLLGDDYADAAVLKRVAVHEALSDHWRQAHDILDLLRSDILTLRQLEDVLRPVNDLDRAVREDLNDVTRLEPAGMIKRISRLAWHLVIAIKDGWTFEQDLASWIWLIRHQVIHIRKTLYSHLC